MVQPTIPEARPTLSPPTKPPKRYPGYEQELQALGIQQYQVEKQLQESRRRQSEITSPLRFRFGSPTTFPAYAGFDIPPLLPVQKARREAEIAEANQAVELSTQQLKSTVWKQRVMGLLPGYLASSTFSITKPDDVLNYIFNDQMQASDIAWLDKTFNSMKHLTNVLPEGYDGDLLSAQKKILEEGLAKPKLQMRAVHNLTVDEISKAFRPDIGKLPEGMTTDDARELLGRVQMEGDERKRIDSFLREQTALWTVELNRMNLLRAGMIAADAPEPTPAEFAKLALIQPFMATSLVVDKYFKILPIPLAAAAIVGVHRVFKTSEDTIAAEVENKYTYYRSMGESSWSAYAKAMTETSMPGWLRFITESAFDPTSYMGIGLLPGIGKKLGSGLTRLGMKDVGARVGPLAQAFESGYVHGADAVFKAGKEVLVTPLKGTSWALQALKTGSATARYEIPKTLTTMSRDFARGSMSEFMGLMGRRFPNIGTPKGLTRKNIIDTVEASVREMVERPAEGNDLMVRVGSRLLEYPYLDSEAFIKLTKGIAELEFDTARLGRLNKIVADMFSGKGVRQATGEILSDLAVEATDDAMGKLSTRLTSFKDKTIQDAIGMAKGSTTKEVFINLFDHLQSVRYGNLRSPIHQHMAQVGQSVSWVSRVADQALYWTRLVALERKFVMPLARWNLLFANFGPGNFIENMYRGFLGGGEFMYPNSWGGIQHTREILGGLSNLPYDIELFARGEERRLAQAMIDPKTGQTAVFEGGVIPFITKNVVLPDWIPFVGGKSPGINMNIHGKVIRVGSFQSQYDMFAELNALQVTYNYQVQFLKAIAEIAPAETRMIKEVADRHFSKLSAIRRFSPSDTKDIDKMITELSFRGPESIRRQAKIDILDMERRLIRQDISKILRQATEVSEAGKNLISDSILDGSMFSKGIDSRMADVLAGEREWSLIALTRQIEILKEEATQYAVNPPKNLTDLLGDMENITAWIEAVGERNHEFRKRVVLRAGQLRGLQADNFHVGSAKLLADFMETSEVELNRMIDTMTAHAQGLSRGGAVDWSKVTFSRIPANKIAEIKSAVDNLPVNLKLNIKAVQVSPIGALPPVRRIKAWWEPTSGTINFSSIKDIDTATLYHELAHAHLQTLYDSSEANALDAAQMLSQFAKIQRPRPWAENIDDIATKIGYEESYELYPDVHEAFAEYLQAWMRNPKLQSSAMRKFFGDNFPRQVPIALNETQLARLADLSSIARLETANILATRQKISEIEAVISKTPARERDSAFWKRQRADKSVIWDEHDDTARRFKDMRLSASRNFLTSIDKSPFLPDFIPEVTKDLTPSHIAYLFGATGDDVYRGLVRAGHQATIRPKEDFVLYVRNQANAYAAKFNRTAKDIGFTDDAIGDVYDQLWRNMGIEPTTLLPDSPTVMQLESIRQELYSLYATNKLSDSDVIKWRQYLNSVADDLEQLPMYKQPVLPAAKLPSPIAAKPPVPSAAPVSAGSPDWWFKKESAMTRAREMHALAFPTYDQSDILTESLQTIFPFTNYELFRWRWLPRTFLRTPGTLTGMVRYVENTDDGYINIPFTNLQIDPFKGSIWLGGLRSAYTKDFPEYYDAIPGMEFVDYVSRMGFYPGIHVMAPIVAFGTKAGKPEFGELAPAWIQSGLSALRALSPTHIGKVIDFIYPDRFRDFQTMLQLGEEGHDADEIWKKKKQGIKLTSEEERLWLRAENQANGVKAIWMQQTGLFRIKPREYSNIRSEMRLAIEEATGVSVSTQEQIDRLAPTTGKRFSDYYKLDILQQKLLYSWEALRRWQGITTGLLPSGWQALDIKINDYYQELDKVYSAARRDGIYEDGKLVRPGIVELNRQLVAGEIGPDQWRAQRDNIQSSLAEATRILGNSPAYKDVPKTLGEREALYAERGILTPTAGPDQELLRYYYELKPEYAWDWEAGRNAYDYEIYYAKIDILLESLSAEQREKFIQRIQIDWTPMERLYWQVSREYLKPYRNIRSIVLEQYTPEQRRAIMRFSVARGTEREELQNLVGPEGEKLISGVERKVREARQNLRRIDSTLDAWLYFFGSTDSLLTAKAKEEYAEMSKKFLTAAMIE